MSSPKPYISIIVPIYNESENIFDLIKSISSSMSNAKFDYEVIAVNDGSTDDSQERLVEALKILPCLKIIELRRNTGQTAAMMAGIDNSTGINIVTIDADLQNDPNDIPMLLDKLNTGADVVSGWRVERQDAFMSRTLVSRVANYLISVISGVHLHDYGCTLKVYRREILEGIRLYGEMHRFVPIYASWMGATVIEVPVRHYPRRYGQSKYGLDRTIKVILDLLVVKFFSKYLVKPIYVFGSFGLVSIFLGISAISYAIYLKYFNGISLIQTPLPILSAMLMLIGLLGLMLGLLAEIMVRTYYESQNRFPYVIKNITFKK